MCVQKFLAFIIGFLGSENVYIFELFVRQAGLASEANTDKRFFNVRYRKNLDNLCAPLENFNFKISNF